MPNTESKSTLRPVELGGWAAGGAENPVLEKTRSDLKKTPQAGSQTRYGWKNARKVILNSG